MEPLLTCEAAGDVPQAQAWLGTEGGGGSAVGPSPRS